MTALEQLVSLQARKHELEAAWLRQLLTLAAGGLTLLVTLSQPTTGFARLFLVGTWISLGLALLSGAAATYLETERQRAALDSFRSQIALALQAARPLDTSAPIIGTPRAIFAMSRTVMISSLIASVVLLVAHAIAAAFAH